MINFDFCSPTKIFFGKNREDEISTILKSYSAKRVLLVYGSGSIIKSGLYDKIISNMESDNIEYFELSGVRPNPSVISVRAGVQIVKEKQIDFILAVGGGSVIDVAKAIAVSYQYAGDPYDFNLYKVQPAVALPIGVILTLSASGSELSSSCVISNDELGVKQGFNNNLVRPVFTILNPELTYSVGKFQTGCGIVDIISHSLERYFSKSGNFEFSDRVALAIIKNTIECGSICINEPNNYDARAAMMLNGSFSHNGIASVGKKSIMPIHAIEHAISAFKIDIAHGAGLSVLIPAWMNYTYKVDIDKFVIFTETVFNLHFVNKDESAKIGIQSLKTYFKSIGMPTTLTELGIQKTDIPAIVDKMTNGGTRLIGTGSIYPLSKEDLISLLNDAI